MRRFLVLATTVVLALVFAVAVLLPTYMLFSKCTAIIRNVSGDYFHEAIEFLWQGWRIIAVTVIILCILLIIDIATNFWVVA